MVHHGLFQGFIFSSCISATCLLSAKCSILTVSLSSFTNFVSSFVPFIFSHLCAYCYTVYTGIGLLLQFYIMQYYIYFTSTNPVISLHRHFLQQYSVYGIISYNSFHICVYILPDCGVNCFNVSILALYGV